MQHKAGGSTFVILSSLSMLIASFIVSPALAQENNVPEGNPPLSPEAAPFNIPIQLTDREVILSCAVLIFGLVVLGLQVFLLRSIKSSPPNVLLTFTTTLIVIGGLFLVTIGLTSDQIAPAFSLYGAIVGYMLGKDSSSKE